MVDFNVKSGIELIIVSFMEIEGKIKCSENVLIIEESGGPRIVVFISDSGMVFIVVSIEDFELLEMHSFLLFK